MDSKAHKSFTIGYGKVKPVTIGNKEPLVFFGGPCAIESKDHAFKMAEEIGSICKRVDIPCLYKSCYD
jgi:2-dehydro-3-deoxyphosphooctonate aldolase (KDO 8-P synthase)